jgi:hypothetical protein
MRNKLSLTAKMVDEHIQLNPNTNAQKTEAQYRDEVEQLVSGFPNINERVRERAEQGLISRSRGYGVELLTDRLRAEGYPPAGRTGALLTALGVSPGDIQKVVDADPTKIGDARKLFGKRLRVS